jgi:hypothetical protein
MFTCCQQSLTKNGDNWWITFLCLKLSNFIRLINKIIEYENEGMLITNNLFNFK